MTVATVKRLWQYLHVDIPNNKYLTIGNYIRALKVASHIVFVSGKQLKLYSPKAPSSVIYVGVPPPTTLSARRRKSPGFYKNLRWLKNEILLYFHNLKKNI